MNKTVGTPKILLEALENGLREIDESDYKMSDNERALILKKHIKDFLSQKIGAVTLSSDTPKVEAVLYSLWNSIFREGKMSKHTKGPWRHNKHPYRNQPEYVLARAPKNCKDPDVEICTVTQRTNIYLDWRTKEEAEANARLIAAAPELLEAAKKVMQSRLPQLNFDLEGHADLLALQAAIAKAEGKE